MRSIRRRCLFAFLLPLGLTPFFTGCGKPEAAARTAPLEAVTALGRIVPGRAAFDIAAPPGDRLATLTVTEGQVVAKGEILATLATHDARKADLDAARIALTEAEARLHAETAHAKATIDQALASLDLAQAQLEFDQRELGRFKSLQSGDATTERRVDEQSFVVRSRELAVTRARAELRMAETGLERTRAAIGIDSIRARVASAGAQLELSTLRAPIAGTVLKVLVHPGEQTGGLPVLKLGDTADMQVIAEIHSQDIGLIKAGQTATITSEAFAAPLTGTVFEIGRLIYKNDVLNLDPRAERDTRVVETRIRFDQPAAVAGLVQLEVGVRIDLRSPPGK